MNHKMQKRFYTLFLGLFLFIFLFSVSAPAQDIRKMEREANNAIRTSQRLMFSSKYEEAGRELEKAEELIEKIQSLDPANSRIKSLTSQLERQRRDLDKRMNKGDKKFDYTISQVKKTYEKMEKHIRDAETGKAQMDRFLADSQFKLMKDQLTDLDAEYGSKKKQDIQTVKQKVEALEKRYLSFMDRQKQDEEAAQARQAQSKDAALELGKKFMKLYDEYYKELSMIHGNALVYSMDVKEAREKLAAVEKLENEVVPRVSPVMAEIARNYGKTASGVDEALRKLGLTGDENYSYSFANMKERMEKIEKSRKATALQIANTYSNLIPGIDQFSADIRVKRANEYLDMLRVGQKFYPGNEKLNAMVSDLDAKIQGMAEGIEKQIDDAKWAGSIKDFAGPGKAKKLAKTAVEYFKNHPNWGKKTDLGVEILDVAVRGQWQPAERNIFGQVIRWRLPIHIAVTNSKLKPDKIARVYELSVLTMEGPGDKTEKAPPFDGYWVGDSYMMRIRNIQ